MAGPNPDSFQRALGRFKISMSRTSPELIDQFLITRPEDVRRVCMEIQDQQGRDGCLRRMRRIEGFIEAMDQLGKSIEVFVNANEFVCFLWVSTSFIPLCWPHADGKALASLGSKLPNGATKIFDSVPSLTKRRVQSSSS